MRRFPFVTVMALLVGAVLTGSLWTMQRVGRDTLHQHQIAQSQVAADVAVGLLGYLDSFDRDARLLATMAQGARRQAIEPGAQDQVILSAFKALATVVPHYRTIALFGPHRRAITAIDPTEDGTSTAAALTDASAELAADLGRANKPTALRGPLALAGGTRWFYLYAAAVGLGESVVVTAEAAIALEPISRMAADASLVVTGPSGELYVGCDDRQKCHLLPAGPERDAMAAALAAADDVVTSSPALVRAGLPARAVIGTTAPVRSPLGTWSVAVIASAADIDVRHRAFVQHLVLTSAGIVAAMLTVGLFLIRQQANAAALGARLAAAEEMATLRERSDKVLENVPVGILGLTRDGRVALVNRFFNERMTEPAPETLNLGSWTDRLRAHLARALATGRSQPVVDVSTGSGAHLRHYDVRVVPLNKPADDIEALALVEDRSELHSLQRQLVRAEKLVTVGVLSAGIAHEVGTPLAVIRGRAEHVLERSLPPAQAEDLRAIIDQIDRISSTIRQVLEFSRGHSPELGEVGQTDAQAASQQAIQLLGWLTGGKRVAMSLRAQDGLPRLAADPQQFEQVMVNLLMNACDASAVDTSIDVLIDQDQDRADHLRITIADQGAGIPAENLNAVFDPYFTTKRRGEGTGLGLAIVAHIVRSHGADIALSSTVGVGTTVTLVWPVAEGAPHA